MKGDERSSVGELPYISSKDPKKIDPKEFEGTEMENHWLKIDNKKKTFI